jgi:hypothetical protein
MRPPLEATVVGTRVLAAILVMLVLLGAAATIVLMSTSPN